MTSVLDINAALSESAVDPRDPRNRLSALLDPGSVSEAFDSDLSGVHVASGRIDGSPVVAFATDVRTMGGAMGAEGCSHIVRAIDHGVAKGIPVVGIWHSGGARLAEGVLALDGVGAVFAAMVRASGRVPQVSVVLGPAAGGAAYGPALTDVVIMSESGRVFVTGPGVVKSVTGEDVDMKALGGPDIHTRKSGVAHIKTADDASALASARDVISLLGRPGRFDEFLIGPDVDLSESLPDNRRRAYDVRKLIDGVLDDSTTVELHRNWAPNIVTRLGRLAGRTVGVVANNPLRMGGCLDSISAEKSARFVRLCDGLGVPLVVLVDVPGYLPGVAQEWDGVVRRGAKLLHAFADAQVPRVTLVTRKAYGGAYIAMNSRSLGSNAVFAWPGAEIAVMGAEAAVGVLHRKVIASTPEHELAGVLSGLIAEHEQLSGGLARAVEQGSVDQIIEPSRTRRILAQTLAACPPGRGVHRNMPL
ncbi:acetyl-CoA/propionyl-CoA carboxylase carboxyl transferase subunit [Nakamurella sp. UYEF19]|uniref:acyl-CoA carboxylase subunit beta n=1 Tax=Nakamurella sp. UYEF19 TaxID=1756392 RepID=UPI003392C47A